MQSLMRRDFVAENYKEELLCDRLEQINNSKDVKLFIKRIEGTINKDIKVFAYRIKDFKSAIRTFRLTEYENIEKMYDLLGFLYVVENEIEINKLEKKLRKKINENNIAVFNLLKEKEYDSKNLINNDTKNKTYIEATLDYFNKLIYMPENFKLLLPPFTYNLIFKKKFKDLDFNVPIEIRIQTKEDFIALESYYYTVHKNDTISKEKKIPLINISFRLLRRMTKLAFLSNDTEKEKLRIEIEQIIKDNKEFIEENKEIFNLIFSENSKLINCWKNKQPIYEFEIKK